MKNDEIIQADVLKKGDTIAAFSPSSPATATAPWSSVKISDSNFGKISVR